MLGSPEMEIGASVYAACSMVSLLVTSLGIVYESTWTTWPAITAYGISHFMHALLEVEEDGDD